MTNEENRDQFYWDLVIELEDKRQKIESCLPKVSDLEFEEYTLIWELLGILYHRIVGIRR